MVRTPKLNRIFQGGSDPESERLRAEYRDLQVRFIMSARDQRTRSALKRQMDYVERQLVVLTDEPSTTESLSD